MSEWFADYGETHKRKIKIYMPNIIDVDNELPDCRFSYTSLKKASLPNWLAKIPNGIFYGCAMTTVGPVGSGADIEIPNSVTTIGYGAFGGSSLTNVVIPSGVTSIEGSVFYQCKSLISVTVNAVVPPTLGTSVFAYNASGRKIYVPAQSVDAYKAADGWKSYASYIEAITE